MLGRTLRGAGVHVRAARFVTATLAVAGFGTMGGCLTRPIETQEPRTTSTVVERLRQSAVDKIDLLLVVDNSASMADKQKILALAIPPLLTGLINPKCIDATGAATATQPAGPLDMCPAASVREFTPVLDIHVGVISSSLGSFGTLGCPTQASSAQPWGNPTQNDAAHLLTRADATNLAMTVPTYQGGGFLAWDPGQTQSPPGEKDLANLEKSLHDIIVGTGQLGCGYESQDEAWYRFLVDPNPSASIPLGLPATSMGTDDAILKQRRAFLRPDSLLAIINVTDETDTSVKESGDYPILTNGTHLPHARSECKSKGPADHCCASCAATPQPSGCPVDPTCAGVPYYTDADENNQIHAFGLVSHKQTYGLDFFYPPSRYVQALTSKTVVDRDGKTVPNPIFSVLDPTSKDTTVRDTGLVFYAAITGVPWQLIARQTNGQPDLTQGFKSSSELAMSDGHGHTFWDDIAGDPESYVAPLSPFMQEKGDVRGGVDPITGISISASSQSTNEINGYERHILQPPGDIEYACTFPILDPLDGTKAPNDCTADPQPEQNPLCGPNPNDIDPGTNTPRYTQQVKAKAYPGLKNLAIARGMGDQGIAASICAKTICDPATDPTCDTTKPDFGYNPAVNAIIDRLKTAIASECLPTVLTPDPTGQVPCLVLEARDTGGAACTCDSAGRNAVTPDHQPAVAQAQIQETSTAGECFCEITQTTGAALTSCEDDLITSNADGWCYVDEAHGNAKLVSQCPPNQKQQVRFVGKGQPVTDAITFIICASN